MTEPKSIEETVRGIAREGFEHTFGRPRMSGRTEPHWKRIRETGSALWLDTGDLQEATALWTPEFEALTTNNTLLNKEVQKGQYDKLIRKTAKALRAEAPDLEEQPLVLEIVFVLNAYHALRLVEQFDAHVSVELHTDLADDVERTVHYGKRYYAVCPERFYVKVPLTPAGFLAARRLEKEGVPINFTLGFSARQNYLAAQMANPRFVNVFLGRLNSFVAERGLGSGRNVGEKATRASAREISRLRETGRSVTRQIAASIRSGDQVSALAGVDVLTMPTKVARQYLEAPREHPTSQVDEPCEIELAEGVRLADFNGATLWEVPRSFKQTVDGLLGQALEQMDPEQLQDHFAQTGFPDFLPRWNPEEVATIAADGKIPDYSKWKDRLQSGQLGLDALINMAGLQAFATDQRALDDRIRSLI